MRRQQSRAQQRAPNRRARSSAKHGKQTQTSNSFLIAATNGQMAGSIAGRAVAADRNHRLPRFVCVPSQLVRTAWPQISNDRDQANEARAIEIPHVAARQNEIEKAKCSIVRTRTEPARGTSGRKYVEARWIVAQIAQKSSASFAEC